MENLFNPYNRLGSGIGLSFSKGLIEQIGGTISGESIYGEGSTFWIELPLIEEVRA
jgi:signal transduction histidine kinase